MLELGQQTALDVQRDFVRFAEERARHVWALMVSVRLLLI